MADKPSRGLADVIAASIAVSGIGGPAGEYLGGRGLTWTPVGQR